MREDILFQKFVYDPEAAWRIIDGEALVLNPSGKFFHILNETGSAIWQLIDGTKTLNDIIDALSEQFDVSSEEIKEEVVKFVKELKSLGIVRLQEE